MRCEAKCSDSSPLAIFATPAVTDALAAVMAVPNLTACSVIEATGSTNFCLPVASILKPTLSRNERRMSVWVIDGIQNTPARHPTSSPSQRTHCAVLICFCRSMYTSSEACALGNPQRRARSEEHTSELQSPDHLV